MILMKLLQVFIYLIILILLIQKKVHFLIDIYIRRNTKEQNINIIKTLSNDVTYRSEKESALKLIKTS
jgi:hypothetical protein